MPNHYPGSPEQTRALDAYVKLSRAAAAVEARVNRHLAAAGLSISQFGVLEALLHLGPLSQGALARKILKSPANLTTVLDNLERRELIGRHRDPADRRVTIVRLSDRGRERIAALFPAHVERVRAAFAPLGAQEQETLAELCRALGLAQETDAPPDDAAAAPPSRDPTRGSDADPTATPATLEPRRRP